MRLSRACREHVNTTTPVRVITWRADFRRYQPSAGSYEGKWSQITVLDLALLESRTSGTLNWCLTEYVTFETVREDYITWFSNALRNSNPRGERRYNK
ncbi:hypothetical protein ACLOJK_013746 [Asimina triloba]